MKVSVQNQLNEGVLNRYKKGILEPGYDADLVLFDEDIQIKKVIIRGRECQLDI